MQLNDYDSYLMLKKVLSSGKFELKGDAIKTVASLIAWFDKQEGRYKPQPKIEEPVKKIKGAKK